ncbi:MAG: DUF6796 family protein [Bacteroidota bacterium]
MSIPEKQNPRVANLYYSGIIGLAGAIMVGIGEFILHYSAGAYGSKGFDFFQQIADWRLTYGYFIVLVFTPLYIMGYWHLYLALCPKNKALARVLFFTGGFAIVVGSIWIGSRAILGAIVKSGQEVGSSLEIDYLLTFYEGHYEVIWTLVTAVGLLISIVFIIIILRGHSLYPRWMIYCNPLLLATLPYQINYILPAVGQYLVPMGFNFGHTILFSLSLWLSRPHWGNFNVEK